MSRDSPVGTIFLCSKKFDKPEGIAYKGEDYVHQVPLYFGSEVYVGSTPSGPIVHMVEPPSGDFLPMRVVNMTPQESVFPDGSTSMAWLVLLAEVDESILTLQ